MLRDYLKGLTYVVAVGTMLSLAGCASMGWGGRGGYAADGCSDGSCQTCSTGKAKRFSFGKKRCQSCGECEDVCACTSSTSSKWWKGKRNKSCDTCNDGSCGKCKKFGGCGKCGGCGFGCCGLGCGWTRSLAIQDEYPLGAVMRAHHHQMQTNGEAADFILFQMDFVGQSAELTPDGKDKVLEMAARMRSAPFPVVIERTWNNADPELDAHRRNLIAQILVDLGNTDANTRVFVSPAYGLGKHTMDGVIEFWQYTYQGFGNGMGGMGGMGGGFGGGMGGGGMGGGFGGGGMGGGFGF